MNPSAFNIAFAIAGFLCLGSPPAELCGEPELRLDPGRGVAFQTPQGTLWLDSNDGTPGPVLRFLPGGEARALASPRVDRSSPAGLLLSYDIEAPGGSRIRIEREITLIVWKESPDEAAIVEIMKLSSSKPLAGDLEVDRPFAWRPAIEVALPLKNGSAQRALLGGSPVRGEYRLGRFLTGKETPRLALPLAVLSGPGSALALYADPYRSALFEAAAEGKGSIRYAYPTSIIPLAAPEIRTFAAWISKSEGDSAAFERAVDRFFSLVLPDLPPGPSWLHEIALVSYDFLSDEGKGWERDARLLGEWLGPEERRRAALCLHGWYDGLGSYSYDEKTGKMKDEWTAFERTRKVKLTQKELKRRLGLARSLGFRVLLYFADGLASDSGLPSYRDERAFRDSKGEKIAGWQGPDTFGPTFLLNPAHPEVYRWYMGYLGALLETYGPDVDGFVWDETFHAREGQLALKPEAAECDRALFRLVKELRMRVKRFDPEKVFLASDCIGVFGWEDVPGYALVADGTYQDTGCRPGAWSFGLFPNWRNTLWSCNWDAMTSFHFTRFGAEAFGAPVAISNGWGNDRGPSEWTAREKAKLLALFRQRLSRKERVRYLREDPAAVLAAAPDRPTPGDAIPDPRPGEVNWALASRGSKASASSVEGATGAFPAGGAIDGSRSAEGWGAGHGWASKVGEPLPQWIQVDLPGEKRIDRFVVIAYEKEGSEETAAKWGVTDYRIEVWDGAAGTWKMVASEAKGRALKVRVHQLPAPVRTGKFRLVVEDTAPIDGVARILELESWGPED